MAKAGALPRKPPGPCRACFGWLGVREGGSFSCAIWRRPVIAGVLSAIAARRDAWGEGEATGVRDGRVALLSRRGLGPCRDWLGLPVAGTAFRGVVGIHPGAQAGLSPATGRAERWRANGLVGGQFRVGVAGKYNFKANAVAGAGDARCLLAHMDLRVGEGDDD